MSIIKRKAGSEDIVKSILEFDDVPTEGSHNLVESGAVAQAIGNLGQPLQWKGPATVAQLNDGITGIQPGWTYTLTDDGTLTDGSIAVEAGDEVAWTEDGEWFKVGCDSSNVAVFEFSGTDYPLIDDMYAEVLKGKTVVLQHNPGGTQYDFYYLARSVSGSGHITMRFVGKYNSVTVADDTWTFYNDTVNAVAIAPLYDSSSAYPTAGTAVMYNGRRYVNNVAINTAEEWTPGHWTEKSVEDEIVDLKDSIGSVNNGGALTDDSSILLSNNSVYTLSTAQSTLELSVVVGSNEIPNFAVEIMPSVNVTLTVTKTVDGLITTLSPSVAGGNTLTSGKKYQVTCVGSCWTLSEFEL